jgi:DNA-binding transcriptional LysR family regulator
MDRFKGIETFVIAAKAGSFAAVAKHLRISRAMVSRRLLELEEHLGVRLLHRTTRKLVLTSAGRHYLEVCSHVMQQLEDEERTLGSLQTEAKGILRIASVRSFGQQHMSAAIGAFSMLYPDIQIEMELAPGTRTPLTLTEFGFDLGIAIGRSRQSDAVMHKIANFDWVMCASPSYLSESGIPRLPADLTVHRCLVNPRHAPKATWMLNVAGEDVEHPVKNALSITSSLGSMTCARDVSFRCWRNACRSAIPSAPSTRISTSSRTRSNC